MLFLKSKDFTTIFLFFFAVDLKYDFDISTNHSRVFEDQGFKLIQIINFYWL